MQVYHLEVMLPPRVLSPWMAPSPVRVGVGKPRGQLQMVLVGLTPPSCTHQRSPLEPGLGLAPALQVSGAASLTQALACPFQAPAALVLVPGLDPL